MWSGCRVNTGWVGGGDLSLQSANRRQSGASRLLVVGQANVPTDAAVPAMASVIDSAVRNGSLSSLLTAAGVCGGGACSSKMVKSTSFQKDAAVEATPAPKQVLSWFRVQS
jgi:hypothetical protein